MSIPIGKRSGRGSSSAHTHVSCVTNAPRLPSSSRGALGSRVIGVVKEDRLPVVTALDDAHTNTRKEKSWLAGHRIGRRLIVSERAQHQQRDLTLRYPQIKGLKRRSLVRLSGGRWRPQSLPSRRSTAHWERRLSSRLVAGAARCRVGGVWAGSRPRARPAARDGQSPGSSTTVRAPGASNPRCAKPAGKPALPVRTRSPSRPILWGYLRVCPPFAPLKHVCTFADRVDRTALMAGDRISGEAGARLRLQ